MAETITPNKLRELADSDGLTGWIERGELNRRVATQAALRAAADEIERLKPSSEEDHFKRWIDGWLVSGVSDFVKHVRPGECLDGPLSARLYEVGDRTVRVNFVVSVCRAPPEEG